MGACARLPSDCSECLPLCPPPQASTTGICALPRSSPRGHSAHPRPQSTSRVDLGAGENRHRPRAPCSCQNLGQKPRTWDPIQWLSSCIHAAIRAYKQIRGRGPRSRTSPLFLADSRAPFPASLPPAQPCPPPQGEKIQLRKGAEERNPRFEGGPSESLSPGRAVPTPTVPQLREGGDALVRGVLPCSARTKPAAGARGRARSRGQRRAGGAEPQVCAPTAGRVGGLEDEVRFALGISQAAASRSSVLSDLLG